MQDDYSMLEGKVQSLLLDICAVLYSYGYSEISVGALMRLVGVPEERACQHDEEFFEITESIRHSGATLAPPQLPPGVTLH